MRTHVSVAIGVLIVFATLTVQAQGTPASADTITRVLDREARIDLVSSVLLDRSRIFNQLAVIQRCDAARVIGPGADPLARVRLGNGSRFVGAIGGECEREPSEPGRGDTVSIAFKRIAYEASEYIPMDRLNPRIPDLIVVRLRVLYGIAESHIEEWVMRKAADQVWTVMTVRMFGFMVI